MCKKTKKDWYDHIRKTIDITTSCKNMDCGLCVSNLGPCRKNLAILDFGKLVELTDLPNA